VRARGVGTCLITTSYKSPADYISTTNYITALHPIITLPHNSRYSLGYCDHKFQVVTRDLVTLDRSGHCGCDDDSSYYM